MHDFPDFGRAFEYENGFYLSCDSSRIGKLIAHYELFKMVLDVPGAIVECGVFKGASLSRFAMFRQLFQCDHARTMVAFDVFGVYPPTQYEADEAYRENFIRAAGAEGVSIEQMNVVLDRKGCRRNVTLVKGDICETVPEFVKRHPHLRIAMLNLDVDIYEPSVTILEYLWPCIVRGGVLVLDDYGTFPGETKAVDDYFAGKPITIRKFPFNLTPCYVVKELAGDAAEKVTG